MSTLQRQDIFPTPLWQFTLAMAESLNPQLLAAIKNLQAQDPQGKNISNSLGWHSHNNLHLKEPFRQLLIAINLEIKEIVYALCWDLNQVIPTVNNCWANVNNTHSSNHVHHHPNSLLSGVYYLQTPENCGSIFFYDPRVGSQMLVPPLLQGTPWTREKVRITPEPGKMVIFPSWLWHGVEPNMSQDERISISFNIGIAQTPKSM